MTSGLVTQRTRVNSARTEIRDGREWLVAPLVALVPGVLNQELVLDDEISRYTPAWDDSPVTVYHPHDGQTYVSARSIEMLDAYSTGRLYDARFEDGRLKGDVWLDVARLGSFGESGEIIVRKINDGSGIEVSTGYFRDVEESSGVYKGRPYVTIARNIRPDHLALLPEAEGACNWEDGCGVPRTNKKESSMTEPKADLVVNQSLTQRVIAALAEAFGFSTEVETVSEDVAPEPAANDGGSKGIVSLFLEQGIAEALALTPGDLPPGSIIIEAKGLSVPLVTYDDGRGAEDTLTYLSGELAGIARSASVMAVPVTGVGRLMTGGDYDVLYLTLGGASIQRWAYDLAEYLRYWAYNPESDEDGPEVEVETLSLILAYIPKDAPTPTVSVENTTISFSHIGVTCGGNQIVFGLAGELRPAPVNPMGEGDTTEDVATEGRFITYADLTGMMALVTSARALPIEAAQETPDGGDEMNDRRQLIESLIASANCQCTREALEAMTTDDLAVMADNILTDAEREPGETVLMPDSGLGATPASNDEALDPEPVSDGSEEIAAQAEGEPEAAVEPEPAAATNDGEPEAMTEAPPAALPAELSELLELVREFGGVGSIREALTALSANAASEHDDLIASLTANTRCAFSAEQLATFTTEQLRLLQTSLEPVDFSFVPRPNGRTASPGSVVVEIPMPTL